MIERGRDLAGSLRLRTEVCVIGSGGGGAVVGAILAESGRDVVMLEQGAYLTNRDFDQREDSMLPLLFEDAGMRGTDDGSISILQGTGVGGSTVHNLSYAFRAPDPVLRVWEEEYGVRELARLEASFERVERGLGVRPILEEEINPLNRSIRSGAELLGYRGMVAKHNRIGCVRSGFCLLGCAYGAKQSMLVTYVPRADAAGARILSDCRAERIEASAHGPHRVRASLLDGQGKPVGDVVVECSVVACCAGAIATPLLLQASGLGAGSGQLGRNLHLHPTVIASGIFSAPLQAYYGIPQAYYIDEFIDLERDPHSGVILMPISGFPVTTATNLPGYGRELYGYLRELPRLGGLLALLHDRSAGEVHPGGGRPRISYRLDEADARQLTEGLKHAVEVLWAAGAERVIVPYFDDPLVLRPEDGVTQIDRRGVRQGLLPLASTHPQSTCRMGADRERCVVDSYGEVHDARRVFVADMSTFPTSLGAPPQITTAALADRTAHRIVEGWEELRV